MSSGRASYVMSGNPDLMLGGAALLGSSVGDVLISWSTLVRGTGQLIQSPVVGKDGQDMVRVAFSLAMLMENGESCTCIWFAGLMYG